MSFFMWEISAALGDMITLDQNNKICQFTSMFTSLWYCSKIAVVYFTQYMKAHMTLTLVVVTGCYSLSSAVMLSLTIQRFVTPLCLYRPLSVLSCPDPELWVHWSGSDGTSPSPQRPACSFPFHLQCEIVAGVALTPGIKRSAIEIWCAPLDDRISFTRRKEGGGGGAGFNGPAVHITVRALVHFVQACDKEERETETASGDSSQEWLKKKSTSMVSFLSFFLSFKYKQYTQ